jgi:hypothetical protein
VRYECAVGTRIKHVGVVVISTGMRGRVLILAAHGSHGHRHGSCHGNAGNAGCNHLQACRQQGEPSDKLSPSASAIHAKSHKNLRHDGMVESPTTARASCDKSTRGLMRRGVLAMSSHSYGDHWRQQHLANVHPYPCPMKTLLLDIRPKNGLRHDYMLTVEGGRRGAVELVTQRERLGHSMTERSIVLASE